jgi:hypothetical protein
MAELNTGDGGSGKKGSKKGVKNKTQSRFDRDGGFGFLVDYFLYAYHDVVKTTIDEFGVAR